MLFAIIFLVAFIALGGFALYISRNVEHGEARFDADGKMISDNPKPGDRQASKDAE